MADTLREIARDFEANLNSVVRKVLMVWGLEVQDDTVNNLLAAKGPDGAFEPLSPMTVEIKGHGRPGFESSAMLSAMSSRSAVVVKSSDLAVYEPKVGDDRLVYFINDTSVDVGQHPQVAWKIALDLIPDHFFGEGTDTETQRAHLAQKWIADGKVFEAPARDPFEIRNQTTEEVADLLTALILEELNFNVAGGGGS